MIAFIRKMFHVVKHYRHIQADQMELHEYLRHAREKAGRSVKDVASALGVTRVQVWRMEKDAGFISIDRLKRLADLYGLPLSSFFEDHLEIDETEISYQMIGMAIDVAEQVANKMSVRPSPEAIRSATLAVIRIQQKRWSEDPKRRFIPEEYFALIEQKFEESKQQ